MSAQFETSRNQSATPLTNIVDDIVADAHDGVLMLGDILDDLGDRSYGPLFFVLGLTIITPIGAVPGVPVILGVILIILSVQFLLGLHHPWMPERFRKLSVSADRALQSRKKLSGTLGFIDRFVDHRLDWAVSRPMRMLAAAAIILLSLAMIPLEFIPFGVAVPGVAITAVGLSIVARDGLVMLVALGFVGATIYLVMRMIGMF